MKKVDREKLMGRDFLANRDILDKKGNVLIPKGGRCHFISFDESKDAIRVWYKTNGILVGWEELDYCTTPRDSTR